MHNSRKCFIFTVLLVIAYQIFMWRMTNREDKRVNNSKSKDESDFEDSLTMQNTTGYKRIHIYNFSPDMMMKNPFQRCKANCFTTVHKKYFKDSEYVLFIAPGVSWTPPKKRRGQTWIFMSHESPHSHPSLKQWKNLVNWTISYRRDSDFFIPYCTFRQLTPTERLALKKDDDLQNKWTIKIAWAVSNVGTPNLRFQFTSLMAKDERIRIDIYGKSGLFKCPKRKFYKCLKLFSQNYTHYLAFENSNCIDYMTEKPTNVYLHMKDTVPIVKGYSPNYALFLPPGSYINVDEFGSVGLLNNYIIQTYKDKDKLRKFFNWRRFYTPWSVSEDGFCELCERIQTKDVKYRRLYDDIDLWYRGDNINPMCTDYGGNLHHRIFYIILIICSFIGVLLVMFVVLCRITS